MSAELDKIKAEVAFYQEVGPLEEELEAAREVKKDEPVRWQEAKQAFEEKRRFYRQIGEYLKAQAVDADDSDTSVGAPVIDVAADAPAVGGTK